MADTEILKIPEIGFARVRDLVRDSKHPERPSIYPWCQSTHWEMVKRGEFPQPIKIGPNMTGWAWSTIRADVERRNQQVLDLEAASAAKRARRLGRKEAA